MPLFYKYESFKDSKMLVVFYYLPNDKILDVTKLKAFAEVKLNIAKMTISLYDRLKNTGERRKCWLQAFSPFPTVFSKAFFFRVVNSQDCVGKS